MSVVGVNLLTPIPLGVGRRSLDQSMVIRGMLNWEVVFQPLNPRGMVKTSELARTADDLRGIGIRVKLGR
jgi:hypothetical protein